MIDIMVGLLSFVFGEWQGLIPGSWVDGMVRALQRPSTGSLCIEQTTDWNTMGRNLLIYFNHRQLK
jgi:hypothetical protein